MLFSKVSLKCEFQPISDPTSSTTAHVPRNNGKILQLQRQKSIFWKLIISLALTIWTASSLKSKYNHSYTYSTSLSIFLSLSHTHTHIYTHTHTHTHTQKKKISVLKESMSPTLNKQIFYQFPYAKKIQKQNCTDKLCIIILCKIVACKMLGAIQIIRDTFLIPPMWHFTFLNNCFLWLLGTGVWNELEKSVF